MAALAANPLGENHVKKLSCCSDSGIFIRVWCASELFAQRFQQIVWHLKSTVLP